MLSPSFPCFLQGSKELWNMLHIDYFWPSFFKKRWKWLYLLRNISSQAVLARNFSLVILISVSVLSRPVSFGTCFNIGVNLNWKTTSHMLRNAKHCRHHALCSYHSETEGWVMQKTVFRPVDTHSNADVKAEWTSFGRQPNTFTCLQNPFGLVSGKENGQSIRRDLWDSSGRCKALMAL